MSTRCRFEGCREKKGLEPCWSCNERSCPTHLARSDYVAFIGTFLPKNFPKGLGYCASCILARCPEHVKGVIDKKCSWIDCTTSLSHLLTTKRLCSYCGKWFCRSHFMTSRKMHTTLTQDLERSRQAKGEGACAGCLLKSEEGKRYAGRLGWLQNITADLGDGFIAKVKEQLPPLARQAAQQAAEGAFQEFSDKSERVGQIARQAAQQAVEGGVQGLSERKEQVVLITAAALDSPVRQRVLGTIVGLVGAQVALLASMIYGASQKDWAFYRTYRWIALGLIVFFLILSCVTAFVRGRRLWLAFEKGGAAGAVAREAALKALLRALVMNLPLLVLAFILALVGGVLLLTLG